VKKFLFVLLAALMTAAGCDGPTSGTPHSASGVKKARVTIETDPEGYSIEQRNVMNRLMIDNKPGSIKHLYVISAVSGQVLMYSTVKGKVTSSGKRLSPTQVATDVYHGIPVDIGGLQMRTGEVLGDDGTYGDSVDYVFWWDVRGAYHQHYVSSGQILHVSDQPIAVKEIVLNLEKANQ
jgi:hypothetical protein